MEKMKKAITMTELQEIAKTKWIRTVKRDSLNPHYDSAKYNATITHQEQWCFVWGSFLLSVNGAEYADSPDSKTWTQIQLNGH